MSWKQPRCPARGVGKGRKLCKEKNLDGHSLANADNSCPGLGSDRSGQQWPHLCLLLFSIVQGFHSEHNYSHNSSSNVHFETKKTEVCSLPATHRRAQAWVRKAGVFSAPGPAPQGMFSALGWGRAISHPRISRGIRSRSLGEFLHSLLQPHMEGLSPKSSPVPSSPVAG